MLEIISIALAIGLVWGILGVIPLVIIMSSINPTRYTWKIFTLMTVIVGPLMVILIVVSHSAAVAAIKWAKDEEA